MTERQIAPYEKFLLTTSRNPSQRTRTFIRDLARVIPWSFHFTRGSCSLNDIADELAVLGIKRAMIIHERKGNPSLAKFYKLTDEGFEERDYRVRARGVALARELKRGRAAFTADSKFRVLNKCKSDFGEQLYNMLAIFFDFNKERELPREANLKGIAVIFSDNPDGLINLEFQQIETQEMIGPRVTIQDVFLGKTGEVIKSLMKLLGRGGKR